MRAALECGQHSLARRRVQARQPRTLRPIRPPAALTWRAVTVPAAADDLTAARGGDADAFARLVLPWMLRLHACVRRQLGSAARADADAEDLLQVVLLRAWELLPQFVPTGPDAFYRSLVALVRGAAGDRRKYLGAKGRGAVVHLQTDADGRRPSPALDPGLTVTRVVAQREDLQRLLALLDALPPTQRAVVERHLLEAASLSEIAAELGVTKNAVWERLQRGLATLRAAMVTP